MKNDLKVYEISLIVKLNQNIEFNKTTEIISKMLDKKICDKLGEDYHTSKDFKEYSFDNLIKFESDRIYKKDKNYVFRIRTINENLSNIFFKLEDFENEYFKILKTDKRIVERKIIEKLYTLTPALLKQYKTERNENSGYWLISGMSFDEFNSFLQVNAIRKYQFITKAPIEFWEENKDGRFFEGVIFKKNGVKQMYKGKALYTDKFEIVIKKDKLSQDIAYMLLGMGILQNNSRGFGFAVPRYMKIIKK